MKTFTLVPQDAHAILADKQPSVAGTETILFGVHHETALVGIYQRSGTAKIKCTLYTNPAITSNDWLEVGVFYATTGQLVMFKPQLAFNKFRLEIRYDAACDYYVIARGSDTLHGSTSGSNPSTINSDSSVSSIFVSAESVQGNLTLPFDEVLVALEGNRTFHLREV